MPPNLLILRQTACIESFLPIGWRTFIWWKNPPKVMHYFGFDCGMLEFFKILLTSCYPKNNCWHSRIFGDKFGRKNCVLCPWKPSAEEVGGFGGILYKLKIRNQKPEGLMSFSRPPQDTTRGLIWPDGTFENNMFSPFFFSLLRSILGLPGNESTPNLITALFSSYRWSYWLLFSRRIWSCLDTPPRSTRQLKIAIPFTRFTVRRLRV